MTSGPTTPPCRTPSTSQSSKLCPSATWYPKAVTIIDYQNLTSPYDIAFDREWNLIISDTGNQRVQKYFIQNGTIVTLVSNVTVSHLSIDGCNNLYFFDKQCGCVQILNLNDGLSLTKSTTMVSDMFPYGIYADRYMGVYASCSDSYIGRYPFNAGAGRIVAGRMWFPGNTSNQIDLPRGLFVDESNNDQLYICDYNNHRIQKWTMDPLQAFWLPGNNGTTVAGGNGYGSSLNQISTPESIVVDSDNRVMYISDTVNNRIVKWLPNAVRGQIIAGGNGQGSESYQFNGPKGIRFDSNGNLFVVDSGNNRVQKFIFKSTSCP
jgi:DNA-binding beta-propeller fold protein YncE